MKGLHPTRRFWLRLQSAVLVLVLCIAAGLLAWASNVWHLTSDWTWSRSNSLTAASRKTLARLDRPITLTAFVQDSGRLSDFEHHLLDRYKRADPRIRTRFVNPDTALAEIRKLGITLPGEIHVTYGDRGSNLKTISESGITNALLRLARGHATRVVFVTGHGEATPDGKRNYDLGRFGQVLARQGFKVSTQNLATHPRLAPDTAFVVIAGAQGNYQPRETKALEDWLAAGGNLLWLHDPGGLYGLAGLAQALGVKPLGGVVADTDASRFGLDNATWVVLSHYGTSPVTRHFQQDTLFPEATGFNLIPGTPWRAHGFLQSPRLPKSWLMTGTTSPETITYRPGVDIPGPITLGYTLTRTRPDGHGQQRAAVVGDSSFLSNQFLGNGGNLSLGLNLFNWLGGEDRYLDITPPQAPDRTLTLNGIEQGVIGIGFLFVLPILLLLVAILVWWRRRRH
jgi:hypothetical protein